MAPPPLLPALLERLWELALAATVAAPAALLADALLLLFRFLPEGLGPLDVGTGVPLATLPVLRRGGSRGLLGAPLGLWEWRDEGPKCMELYKYRACKEYLENCGIIQKEHNLLLHY